jgi:hypothetical protein
MSLPKFHVAALNRQQAFTNTAVVSAVKMRLLMWARQEILARHTNQGKGSSNASLCAALIAVVLFMSNEFCQSVS